MNLYELSTDLKNIKELLEADENNEQALELYNTVEKLVQEKNENCLYYMMNQQAELEQIDKEIKRLQELKQRKSKALDNFKEYVKQAMELQGIKNIDTAIGKVTYFNRKNSKVVITDEDKLAGEFKKEVVTVKIDKIAIKEAIKQGKEVAGAMLEDTNGIKIPKL